MRAAPRADGEAFDEAAVGVSIDPVESSHPEVVRYYVALGVER